MREQGSQAVGGDGRRRGAKERRDAGDEECGEDSRARPDEHFGGVRGRGEQGGYPTDSDRGRREAAEGAVPWEPALGQGSSEDCGRRQSRCPLATNESWNPWNGNSKKLSEQYGEGEDKTMNRKTKRSRRAAQAERPNRNASKASSPGH